mgnify:CR=1 FL=1
MPSGADLALQMIIDLKDEASAKLKGLASTAKETDEAVGGINKNAMLLGGAAVAGAAALGAALWDAGKAAAEENQGIQLLGNAVKNTGADWDTASAAIEAYLEAETRRVGLDDGEGRASLTRLVTITGDVSKAMEMLTLAQDLAAAKGIDLSTATEAVGKAYMGNTMILKQYGIDMSDLTELETAHNTATQAVTKAQEALAVAMKSGDPTAVAEATKNLTAAQEAAAVAAGEYNAALEATGGPMERLKAAVAGAAEAQDPFILGQKQASVALGNLKETIGAAVLPAMASLMTAFASFANDAIPKVQAALEWLGENMDIVVPVIVAMGTALFVTMIPSLIAMATAAWAAAAPIIALAAPIIAVGVAVAALALAWKNDWGGIRTFIEDVWNNTLKPIFEALKLWFETTIPNAINGVTGAIEKVVGWFNTLGENIANLKDKLPAWLTPGSPTPLELGLIGIGEAFQQVVIELARFGAELKSGKIDNVMRFGSAIDAFSKAIKDLGKAFEIMRKVESSGGVPDLSAWANTLKESIVLFSIALRDAAKEVREKTIRYAQDMAGRVEQIFEMLQVMAQTLVMLNEVTTIPDLGPFGAALKQAILVVTSAIMEAAQQLGDQALKSAAKLAGDVEKIIGVIGPAVQALGSMAEMKEVEDLRGKGERLEEAINIFVYYINRVAQFWATTALETAVKFSENAQKIIGLVGPACQAVGAIAEMPEVADLRDRGANLEAAINIFVYYIQKAAEFWAGVALDAAVSFSESAGKIIALIGPAVQAVTAMLDMPEIDGLRERGARLEEAINILVYHIQKASQFWAGQALEEVAAFAQATTTIVGMVKPSIEAIVAMTEYVAAVGLEEAMAAFETDLITIVGKLGEIAERLAGEEGIGKAQAFATAAEAIRTAIETGLGALSDLSGGGAASAAAALEGFAEAATQAMAQAAEALGKGMTAIADAARAGAQNILETLRPLPQQIGEIFSSYDWGAIGSGIASGIAAGIKAGSAVIKQAAKDAAATALASAKKELGIASPSEVMREQVGQMMARGWALGIRDMMGELRAAMADMAGATLPSQMQPAYAGVAQRATPAVQKAEQAVYNLTYVDQRPSGGPADLLGAAERLEWRARMRR